MGFISHVWYERISDTKQGSRNGGMMSAVAHKEMGLD